MKKILASFGWMLLLLPLISVAGARTAYMINTNAADERKVSDFNGISSGGSFKIYVQMGQKESLRLEGNEDDIRDIETVVEGGILKIRYKKRAGVELSGWQNISRSRVNVYITAVSLNSIATSGSGDVEVKGVIKSEKLQNSVSGSGSILLSMAVNNYNAAISGSGQIIASGSSEKTSVSVSGSGRFSGGSLKSSNADVKVSGSGDISIYASTKLNAAVSGSGAVKYAGSAQVNSMKSGSGRIIRM